MLDSGAPTEASQGRYLDIDEYAQVIKWTRQKKKLVRQVTAVSLDVIPTETIDPETSAKASFQNFRYFQEQGIESLAVFHHGEEMKWLDRILEHTSDIALGGMKENRSQEDRHSWLDQVFNYLDKRNIRGLTVHGFAQTAVPTMTRYQWDSVDSTSAVKLAGYGKVMLPRFTSRGYNYRQPVVLYAGDGLPPRYQEHTDHISGTVKEEIRSYLSEIGFTYSDLSDYYKRMGINVQFFTNFLRKVKL
jgi:hypothetical protein